MLRHDNVLILNRICTERNVDSDVSNTDSERHLINVLKRGFVYIEQMKSIAGCSKLA
jgi:hypothetical protein